MLKEDRPDDNDTPWRRHYGKGVPYAPVFEEICMPDILRRRAAEYPEAGALSFQGYVMSYRELQEAVDRMSRSLVRLGVKRGDPVAILLPNTMACVISFYAILAIGAVVVMNNPLYTDPELEYQFNDAGCETLITLDLLARRMIGLRERTRLRQIIYTGLGDYLPFPKNLLFPLVAKHRKLSVKVPKTEGVMAWKALMDRRRSASPAGVALSLDDPAMYQYTGGTTGIAKGAVLTHGNLSRQVQQIAAWFPEFERGKETLLGALPFFHVFGLSAAMNFSIFMGWKNVLVAKPTTEALLEAIHTFRPTFAPLVPTMYIGILNHPGFDGADLSSIKGCFSGSAPLPHEVIKAFEEKTGATIVEGYGLTEACPVTHVNPFDPKRRKLGSIGLPIPGTRCRIVDILEGETDVPPGQAGELLIRGPQVMKMYLNRPEESASTLKNGWLHTGDIAIMDEEGYFYIVDRKKDMIISSGYNVYPRDIEEALFDHPTVMEAAAIGVPHPRRGEAVKVFVVLKPGQTVSETELIAHCAQRLAKYKLPQQIEFSVSLPKNNIGKVLKRELRRVSDRGQEGP